MFRYPGSFTSGESEAVRLVGPSAPATNRCRPESAVTSSATLAREARGGEIQFADHRLQAVIRLRDGGGIERVGGDQVRTGEQVLAVDGGDDVRLRDGQQIVVAAQVAAPLGESSRRETPTRPADAVESWCPWRRP